MRLETFAGQAVLFAICATLVGCASTQPVAYADLQSSARLRPNPQDKTGHMPYRVASGGADWRRYARVIVEPVVIYRGPDQQFEDVTEADKLALADYMHAEFSARLQERFKTVEAPMPDTLRIRLTLTGAKSTTRGISTFTRFDLAGGPYNIVQSIRGGEGTFTGSVTYAVEIMDATTGEPLDGFVTKQFPNALNLGATLGRLDAARTGIDKGANELVAQLRKPGRRPE